MGGVNIFGSGQLPRDEAASLAEHLGHRPRVLAWGQGEDGVVVALDDRLTFRGADGWTDVPWHRIFSGGLGGDGDTLRWRLLDGTPGEVRLERPGRIPEAFRERVEATILLQRQLVYSPGRVIVVSARRDLGNPDAAATWAVHSSPGVPLEDPEVRAFADAELERLRTEYAF